MLVDTNFFIDLIEEKRNKRRGPAHQFMADHRAHKLEISIITWGELCEGFTDTHSLNEFLRNITVLGFPSQIAWTGGQLQRHLRSMGQRLGENDAWIAATALIWGKTLVTRDRDFERAPISKSFRIKIDLRSGKSGNATPLKNTFPRFSESVRGM